MHVNIRIEDRRLRRLMRIAPTVAMAAAEREIGITAQKIARRAREDAPKAFSTLTQSIIAERTGQAEFTVSAGAAHAASVEFGRKAGPVPFAPLREWVRVKRLQTAPADISRVAYFIQQKIRRVGTKAQPFFYPAADAHARGLSGRIADRIAAKLRGVR